MSITLSVKGVPYDNFISAQVEVRLDVLCNTFSFVVARSALEPLPFKVGEVCEVKVNEVLVLTGTIELMTVSYSDNSHQIELAGRDNTSDILDSTLDSLSDFQEGPTLKSIIEQVISHIGSDVKVVDNSDGKPFNPANDIASPEPGDNAFTFIEGLARQKQVLLTSNGDSNIVITQGSTNRLGRALLQNVISPVSDNNIKNATVSYDNTGRYNLYKLTSQGNPSALENAGETDLDSIIDRSGRTQDTEIRKGRQLILSAESSFSDESDFDRSKWEANIRRARGRLYTVEVEGFAFDDTPINLWDINKLVPIVDEFAGIEGDMLINTVAFSLSNGAGSVSKITLVEPDAYTLELEEPVTGEGFV